jgi:hypothetical protein
MVIDGGNRLYMRIYDEFHKCEIAAMLVYNGICSAVDEGFPGFSNGKEAIHEPTRFSKAEADSLSPYTGMLAFCRYRMWCTADCRR